MIQSHFATLLLSLTTAAAALASPWPPTESGAPGRFFGGVHQAVPDTLPSLWTLDAEQSEARYRVREQLAGFDFPNDAIGASTLTGTLVLQADGTIDPDRSEFRIQLASLTSDNERRDRYVSGRTLQVSDYPEAVLVPLRFEGLPSPLPDSGSTTFQMEGALTLHGLTRTTVWEVAADFGPEVISGFATTAFPFNRFEIPVPSVARVLSVDDTIRLELDFRMVKEGE